MRCLISRPVILTMKQSIIIALVCFAFCCVAFGQAPAPSGIVAECHSDRSIRAKFAERLQSTARPPVCNLLMRNRPFRPVRTDGIAYTAPPTPTAAAQAMPPESVSIERVAESTQEIKLSPPVTNPPRVPID